MAPSRAESLCHKLEPVFIASYVVVGTVPLAKSRNTLEMKDMRKGL
jgi:hypothetical protein